MKLPVSRMPRLCRAAVMCGTMITVAGGVVHAQSPASQPTAVTAPAADSPAVDFNETATAYTVRIALSADDAAKLNLKMDGDRLKLSVPHGNSSFQQSFQFPEADLSKTPAITRDGNTVVISIPKGASSGTAQSAPPEPASQQTAGGAPDDQNTAQTGDDAMDSQIAGAFARMQQQMSQAMKVMQTMSGPNGFGGLLQGMQSAGSNVSLDELPDRYVVHASFPNGAVSNVKVSVDNGRILKITGSGESKSQNGGFSSSASSSFTQFVTLPGPVQEDKITLDHKDGDLVITVPRA